MKRWHTHVEGQRAREPAGTSDSHYRQTLDAIKHSADQDINKYLRRPALARHVFRPQHRSESGSSRSKTSKLSYLRSKILRQLNLGSASLRTPTLRSKSLSLATSSSESSKSKSSSLASLRSGILWHTSEVPRPASLRSKISKSKGSSAVSPRLLHQNHNYVTPSGFHSASWSESSKSGTSSPASSRPGTSRQLSWGLNPGDLRFRAPGVRGRRASKP